MEKTKQAKKCAKCEHEKKISEFYDSHCECRDCTKKLCENDDTKLEASGQTEKCPRCEQIKMISEYYRGNDKCKNCLKEEQRERNKLNREKMIALKNDPKMKDKPKVCRRCKETKTISDFRINRGECIGCERTSGRKYNKENKSIRQKWQDKNKEHFDELRAERYQRKKPEIRKKYTDRCKNDKCFKIHQTLKKRLQGCIKKVKSTEEYTGAKYAETVKWLEYNFTDEMNWKNHGTYWDIDHVIPVSRWNLNDEKHVEMCFNWKNLSPLEKGKNRNEKRDKIDIEQVTRHIENLKKYHKENELDDDELQKYQKQCNYRLIKYWARHLDAGTPLKL